jgi:DNA-binding CsgD family transcriptional regulator
MATAVARAEARFKQLCCLGLGGKAVMPALFRELRTIIPSSGQAFFFVDERGTLSDIYDENPETGSLAPLYMEEFYDRRERSIGYSFSDSLRQRSVHGLEEIASVDLAAFRRSEFYNVIFRPLGYDDFIRLVVRAPGRIFGAVSPHRSPGERRFTPEDRRRLAGLESFLAHAFADERASSAALVESGAIGLIIADSAGRPVYFSGEGRRLLFLATHPRTEPCASVRRGASLPPALVRLCRTLGRVFSDDPSAAAPVHHHRNVWGGFSFRAHWLEAAGPGARLIGITVSHQEPLPVKLTHNLQHLALSRRQSEVCLLLAMGSSYDQIANKLGISKHTAIAHGRWIYDKLDVHNRAELINRLLCAQP